MSFKSNNCQQLTFDDSLFSLTERERKALEKSCAKIFADEIFPAIDEKRFSVLYSEKASRPNTPVNVIVDALIIKELFDYSDDENLRNNFHINHLPRGRQKGKFFFGGKVATLNFRKLFNYRKGLGNYAQNPALT